MSPLKGIDYPRWADSLLRIVRSVMYICGIILGFGGAFLYSPADKYGAIVVMICSLTALVASTVCAVANFLKLWMLEWVALFFLTGAIGLYACSVWPGVFTTPTRLTGAAGYTMLFLAHVLRVIDLTVFYQRYVKVATVKQIVKIHEH